MSSTSRDQRVVEKPLPEMDEHGNQIEYEYTDEEIEEEIEEDQVVLSESSPSVADQRSSSRLALVAPPAPSKSIDIPTRYNPFDSSFEWGSESFSKVTITVPKMTRERESTNDMTRATSPECRYWKVPVLMGYNGYTSETIRIDGVVVPFAEGKAYGSTFVYAPFPIWLRNSVFAACKKQRPTNPDDPSLTTNKEQWWKSVNFKENSIGVVTVNDGVSTFIPISLKDVFARTKMGVRITFEIKVMLKASTVDRQPISDTVPGKLAIEATRGFVVKTEIECPPAPRILKQKSTATPSAYRKDVADQSLLDSLARLNIPIR